MPRIEDDNNRIWDYAGCGYVHRLIEGVVDNAENANSNNVHTPTTPTKIVEVSPMASLSLSRSSQPDNSLENNIHTKLEGMAAEYVDLLNTELGKQRKFYETVIDDMREGYLEKKKELAEEGDKKTSNKNSISNALKGQLKALRAKEAGASEKFSAARDEVEELRGLQSGLTESMKEKQRDLVRFGVTVYREEQSYEERIKTLNNEVEKLMLQLG